MQLGASLKEHIESFPVHSLRRFRNQTHKWLESPGRIHDLQHHNRIDDNSRKAFPKRRRRWGGRISVREKPYEMRHQP